MATTKLLISNFRRRTPLSLLLPFSLLTPANPPPPPLPPPFSSFTHASSTTPFRFFSSNSFNSFSTHELNSITESELRSLGLTDGADVTAAGGLVDDSIFPIRALVSLLDGYHDLTGLPWWIVIASSTLALRLAIFPMVILQLHKLKQIAEVLPKLPPPFPMPPFSRKSFVSQFVRFQLEKRALGCPSFMWFIAAISVQVPCFLLGVISIRKMSLDSYPGFDTGGTLWFQDLTEAPNGVLGPIFPLMIAGLHYVNIQLSFRSSSMGALPGLLGLLVKLYVSYLKLLTVPLLFTAFYIPQGSLVYWVTNSSLSLIQLLCLQNPAIREKLGLPDKGALLAGDLEKKVNGKLGLPDKGDLFAADSEKVVNVRLDAPRKRYVSAFDLSPQQLVNHSVSFLSEGKIEKVNRLLRLAVEKDPDYIPAWTLLGQITYQIGLLDEAAEYSESAIAKISQLGEPYDAEKIDFLIQASLIAGVSYHQQGNLSEAHVQFKRMKDMKEPENPESKDQYYKTLVVFASLLSKEGRKDEAAQYLQIAIAHDPQYTGLLEQLKSEINTDDFVNDLASSRRADY